MKAWEYLEVVPVYEFEATRIWPIYDGRKGLCPIGHIYTMLGNTAPPTIDSIYETVREFQRGEQFPFMAWDTIFRREGQVAAKEYAVNWYKERGL